MNSYTIELERDIMNDKIEYIVCGFNGSDYDVSHYWLDFPPADPICFNMAKLGEPGLTYDEFLRRWRSKTIELRNKKT